MKHKHPRFGLTVLTRIFFPALVILLLLFSVLLYFYDFTRWLEAVSIVFVALIVVGIFVYRAVAEVENELDLISLYLKENIRAHGGAHSLYAKTDAFYNIYRNLDKVFKRIKKKEAKLRLKNQQRADMLSAIAHEFRNPIASIMGYAQTLTQDNVPLNLQERFLRKIYRNGEKIELLLSRLLLWNTFESDTITLHQTKCEISELVAEVIDSLRERYGMREIIVEGDKEYLEVDRALFEIVIKNLVENALKYSDNRVVVKIQNGSLCVIDFGIGIEAKELDKITKKFYKSTQNRWDNSMGLGLSIVKKILKAHGMQLKIESSKDKGSCFCVVYKPSL